MLSLRLFALSFLCLLAAACASDGPPPFPSPTAQPPTTAPTQRPVVTPTRAPTIDPSPTLAAGRTPGPTATEVPLSCRLPDPESTPDPSATPGLAVRLASPASAPTPSPYTPTRFGIDATLEQKIRAILGEDGIEHYAVFVKDLQTGRGVMLNTDRVYYAASIFKLFVMYEVFFLDQRGVLTLEDPLLLTAYYDSFGLGPRRTKVCQKLTVEEALAAMMSISDNAAAVLLQDLVGAGNINRTLTALGLQDSGLFTDDLPLSARDAGLLLEAIVAGHGTSRDAANMMVDLMRDEVFDNGLAAGLPRGTDLAHKTGNWPNATHDAGIVTTPRGSYIIVVLTDQGYVVAPTKAISTAVYEHFNP